MKQLLCFLLLAALAAGDQTCASDASHLIMSEDVAEGVEGPNARGIGLAKEGNFLDALPLFRAANVRSPHRGDVWNNLGMTLRSIALSESDDETALPMLREAVVAFQLAVRLLHGEADDALAWTVDRLRERTAASTSRRGTRLSAIERRNVPLHRALAMQAEESSHIKAVNMVCKGPASVTVRLSAAERCTGAPSAFTASVVWALLRICGVVVVEGAIELPEIEAAHAKQSAAFERFRAQNIVKDQQYGDLAETSEYGERGESRYEVKLSDPEMTFSKLALNRWVLAVAKLVLSNAIEIDTFSAVTSLGGAPTSHWHNDVPSVYKHTMMWPTMLPAQGVVVVVPLVELNATTGPTEFYMGSHVNMGGNQFWTDRDETPLTRQLALSAKLGSVVVFDMRLRHRGTANRGVRPRPILYVGIVHDWYFDRVNFKDAQSREWDARESVTERKLFTRIDSRSYLEKVKDLVRLHVPNGKKLLHELESTATYKKVGLQA